MVEPAIHVSFANPREFSNKREEGREAREHAAKFIRSTELIDAGARSIELRLVVFDAFSPVLDTRSTLSSGGYHTTKSDRDAHMTAVVKGEDEEQLHFYDNVRQRVVDRIHIPRPTDAGWGISNRYVHIPKEQYDE